MVAAHARTDLTFSLATVQPNDAPEGRKLLTRHSLQRSGWYLLMDCAYGE